MKEYFEGFLTYMSYWELFTCWLVLLFFSYMAYARVWKDVTNKEYKFKWHFLSILTVIIACLPIIGSLIVGAALIYLI